MGVRVSGFCLPCRKHFLLENRIKYPIRQVAQRAEKKHKVVIRRIMCPKRDAVVAVKKAIRALYVNHVTENLTTFIVLGRKIHLSYTIYGFGCKSATFINVTAAAEAKVGGQKNCAVAQLRQN